MTNPNDQNALDFVRASNKDKLYQATLKEVQDNLSEETKTKIKDMLKTKSPEQVRQAIYLFFKNQRLNSLRLTLRLSFDSRGVFLYTDLMQLKTRKLQLKLRKTNELIIKLKVKYLDKPSVYQDINKIDEKLVGIDRLIDSKQ